ncbi:MAG: HAMP domain-containing histidine kinase [Ruminococcaceae bacterium]|nr:HAMP domain-containing histidine kinase [Oscillospiraceae bacterium]
MTKSVFRRFLFFSLAISLICLIIIGGILAFPVSRRISDYKRSSLEESALIVADYASDISYSSNSISGKELVIADSSFDSMAESMHAVIIVVDRNGILLYSSDKSMPRGVLKLSPSVMDKLQYGNYYEHGTLQNMYNKRYYISAVPYYQNIPHKTVMGYCLVAQTSLWTADYTPTIFGIILLIVVIVAILIFILLTVYAYNTTRPLKQMADAAKRFAVGDFESRGHIKSNDEIGELAAAFNEMADSLASSEGMRRNFIANVSHELKTPMTTIAGYIDGILDNTIPKEEQEYYLGIISQEVKRLNRLVTSMISLSKIDSGEITLKKSPFIIQNTVFNVLLSFEGDIEKKHLSIEGLDSDEDIKIYGDSDLIHQVLYNLVENAVKFTNDKGYIRFGFAQKDSRVYIYVENSGEGIPPEDIRLVFDKFYKADKSRSINKKSMGLGLYIVRSIILLHGGNIFVESEPENYTRFTFWIPDIPKKQKELPDTIKEEQ